MSPRELVLLVFIGDAASGKTHLARSSQFNGMHIYDIDVLGSDSAIGYTVRDIMLPAIVMMRNFQELPESLIPHVTSWYLFRNGSCPNYAQLRTSEFGVGQYVVVPKERVQ